MPDAPKHSADWLTPHLAAELVSSRLTDRDGDRAREIILDQAADGTLKTKAGRLAFSDGERVEEHAGKLIPAGLWRRIKNAATYVCWETGDFDIRSHEGERGWIIVTIREVRFLRSDVQALLSVLSSSEEGAPVSSRPNHADRGAWSEANMSIAIASSSYSDRDTAWKEHFRARKAEHGWGVDAFRALWSTARGTKGHKGRPAR